jgi:hypothetical protein
MAMNAIVLGGIGTLAVVALWVADVPDPAPAPAAARRGGAREERQRISSEGQPAHGTVP